tara:strand:+ start:7187 stop:7822 length:636 start_codon:yes stop_codon:yes gene_type:complete
MSKLKTVWDAVNELRGDLLGSTYANTHKENYKTLDVYLHVVLTNDYDPQPIGSFVIYSSDQSARGDVRFICTIAEFNALVEDMTLGLDVNPVNHGHYLNYVDADKALLKNENNTLVYTQEMADDGELPSVGMNCAWNAHTTNVIITFVGEEMFCGENDTGKEVAGYISDLKPIDTRTKKEKAIDEIKELCFESGWSTQSALESAYDKWVGE